MNILISGLTLHNNKGGPALAMSLKDIVQKQFPNADVLMSVPRSKDNLKEEKKWAEYYGVSKVFPSIGAKELLSKFLFDKNISLQRTAFVKELGTIDLIIDLNALSYMDLDYMSFKQNLIRNLSIYSLRYFSNMLKIPMIRWTQSYGPFRFFITKRIVQKDLENQKNIFTRGINSYNNIVNVLPNKNVFSFPDIAISLRQETKYYESFLSDRKYISLSPSSVIYNMQKEKYIDEFRIIINALLKKDFYIVLVPHNLMKDRAKLGNCDLKVCEKIVETLDNIKIHIVKEDLDVYNLKGIIANAFMHIGSRYHSIIASLSSGVPTVAFSWHEKYVDIMRMYEMQDFVHEKEDQISDMMLRIDDVLKNHDQITSILKIRQNKLLSEINKNMVLFMGNYNDLQSM